MKGYVLAKKADKYLVMPANIYSRLNRIPYGPKGQTICQESFRELLECTADTVPSETEFEKYDYLVTYEYDANEKTMNITEFDEANKIGKLVFGIKNINNKWYNQQKEKYCYSVGLTSGYTDTFYSLEADGFVAFSEDDSAEKRKRNLKNCYFLFALYKTHQGAERNYIGMALFLNEVDQTLNYLHKKINFVSDKKICSDKAPAFVEGEKTVTGKDGTIYRFGVLTGYRFTENEGLGYINDSFTFKMDVVEQNLLRAWGKVAYIEEKQAMKKVFLAYAVDKNSRVCEVRDAMDFAREIPWVQGNINCINLNGKKQVDIEEEVNVLRIRLGEELAEFFYAHIRKNHLFSRRTNSLLRTLKNPKFLEEYEEASEEMTGQEAEEELAATQDTLAELNEEEDEFVWDSELKPNEAVWCRVIRYWDGEKLASHVLVAQPTEEETGKIIIVPKSNPVKYQAFTQITEGGSVILGKWNDIVPLKRYIDGVEEIREVELKENVDWFYQRACEKIKTEKKNVKDQDVYKNDVIYQIEYRVSKEDPCALVPVLVWIRKKKLQMQKLWYVACTGMQMIAGENYQNRLVAKYGEMKKMPLNSEEEYEDFFFLAVNLAEFFANKTHIAYTKYLKDVFLKRFEMDGLLALEAENEEKEETFDINTAIDYRRIVYWAEEVVEAYLGFTDLTPKHKEWMVRLLLRLPEYFAGDIIQVLEEKLDKNIYEEKLGVSWEKLIELRKQAAAYEETVKNGTDLLSVLTSLKDERYDELKSRMYGDATEKLWEEFQKLAEYEGKIDSDEFKRKFRIKVAQQVHRLKAAPNKIVSEVFLKEREFSKIADAPELHLTCKEKNGKDNKKKKMMTLLRVYKEQEYLRLWVDNSKKDENSLERMPANITAVKLLFIWNEVSAEGFETEREESLEVPVNNITILPGKGELIEIPFSKIQEKEFWKLIADSEETEETEEAKEKKIKVELKISVKSTGDYHYVEECIAKNEASERDYDTLEKETEFDAMIMEIVSGGPVVGDEMYLSPEVCTDDKYFVGRRGELKRIADWIQSDFKHIYIAGMKQCGKSSLISQVLIKNTYELQWDKLYQDAGAEIKSSEKGFNDVIVIKKDSVSSMSGGSAKSLDVLLDNMRLSIVNELRGFIQGDETYRKDEELQGLCKKFNKSLLFEGEEVKAFAALLERAEAEGLVGLGTDRLKELIKNINSSASFEMRFVSAKEGRFFKGAVMNEPQFKEWMEAFNDVMQRKYQKRYKIVLIIDEFTVLCKDILREREKKEDNEIGTDLITHILIDGFNVKNIATMAVGHEVMKLMLNSIITDSNAISKKEPILLRELKPKDVNELLLNAFAGNGKTLRPFEEKALVRMQELSGCSASVLKELARKMYEKYKKGRLGEYITVTDVERCADEVVKEVLNSETTAIKAQGEHASKNALFEPFLRENKEEEQELNEQIVAYLSAAAKKIKEQGICPVAEVEDLNVTVSGGFHHGRRVREVLVDRGVIENNIDEVIIKVQLLLQYLTAEE